MTTTHCFRVVSYNTHKSIGVDRKISPARIVEVLREIDADIIGLQEVLSIPDASAEEDQARYFASQLGYHYCLGETRKLRGGIYGNVILTRVPVHSSKNYDISVSWRRERRGCLRADLQFQPSRFLHIFNVHLGTDYFERRRQAKSLVHKAILHNEELNGTRIVMGDFNEWTHGLASRMLGKHFVRADTHNGARRIRTFPGFLPLLALDNIYFDAALKLERFAVYKSRLALVASDHLPVVADLEFHAPPVI